MHKLLIALVVVGSCQGATATEPADRVPTVVTDLSNRIVDMPPGVRWDIDFSAIAAVTFTTGDMAAQCDHAGGELIYRADGHYICEGIDF